jgi:pimeloyl-ACP methyl ester carboxylesterase
MTPPRSAQALVASIPHARVTTIDCGHSLMTERPDEVRAALEDFMRGLN